MANSAEGNKSHGVKNNLAGNQVVFDIVTEDESSDGTNLAPGIYAFGGKKQNHLPVRLGEVVGVRRNFDGVLGFLPISKVTQRSEAISIVNGKILIFSSKTRDKNKDSYIELGTNEKVFDSISGLEVPILPITDIENVNLYIPDEYALAVGQLVLMSIKQPNQFGDGITIAFVVEDSRGSGSALKLKRSPVVLDYQFLNNRALESLIYDAYTSQVVSRLHLLRYSLPQPEDQPAMKAWRSELGKYAKTISNRSASSSNLPGQIPLYSVLDGSVSLRKLPVATILKEPVRIYQRVDPILGRYGIRVSTDNESSMAFEDPNTNPSVFGLSSYNVDTKKFRFYPAKSHTAFSYSTVVGQIDNTSYIFLQGSSDEYHAVPLPMERVPGFETPLDLKNISVSHIRKRSDDERGVKHLVLASYQKTGEDSRTVLMEYTEYAGTFTLMKTVRVTDTYYPQAELEARVIALSEAGRSVHGFDNVTSRNRSGSYTRREDRTTPYLNLDTSKDNELKQIYGTTLEDVSIQRRLRFKSYNTKGALEDLTGFYVEREIGEDEGVPQSKVLHFVKGVNLKPFGKEKSGKRAAIIDETLSVGSKIPELELTVVPFVKDPLRPATKTFEVLLHVDGGPAIDNNLSLPLLNLGSIPAGYSRLQGATLIQGRRKALNEFSILYFFGPTNKKAVPGVDETTGIYIQSYRIDYDDAGFRPKFSMSSTEDGYWLTADRMTATAMVRRLNFDAAGHVYWVENPEEERASRRYVRKLIGPRKKHHVGRSGLTIRPNEVFESKKGKSFEWVSRWSMAFKTDLKERFEWFEKFWGKVFNDIPEFGALDRKKRARDEMIEELEGTTSPAFSEYLEKQSQQGTPIEHQVVLVEESLKQNFLELMTLNLAANDDSGFSFKGKKSRDFRFYLFDENSTKKEIISEINRIALESSVGRSLLFADARQLLSESDLVDDNEDLDESDEDSNEGEAEDENEDEDDKANRSRLGLIALEGEDTSLREIRRTVTKEKTVPTMILATPEEWRLLQMKNASEVKAGLLEGIKVNANFLTASWSVWGPSSHRAKPEVKSANRAPISKEEHQVFPNLSEILLEAADLEESPKHRIIVVPDDLKTLVDKLIMGRWATDVESLQSAWNHSNPNLALFKVDRSIKNSQDEVLDNFEAMRGAAENRSVALVAEIDDIVKIGRPVRDEDSSGRSYKLYDPASANGGDIFSIDDRDTEEIQKNWDEKVDETMEASEVASEETEPSQEEAEKISVSPPLPPIPTDVRSSRKENDSSVFPHLLWYVATEGQKLQPGRSKNWNIEDKVDPKVSVLLIGSEKDLVSLEQETQFEGKFFDFREHFEITHLDVPSQELKETLVTKLFERPEIESIGYQFNANEEGLEQEESRRRLISRFVSRVEATARTFNQEPTSAFIRAFSELRRSLGEDNNLRRSRLLDSSYLERLLSRVFPMPLSMGVLEEGDPLLKMKDPDQAAMELEAAGYKGSLELKSRIVETVLSQTRGTDEGRQIPSSTILFGGTSTGKTFLFKTLVRWLGLKLYDFDKPYDEEVGAMIVHLGTVVSDEEGETDPSKLTVSRLIEHVENFLAQPNGNRGFLLFDDMHKASSKVLPKIMAYIQSLFEAPNGMVRVSRLSRNGQAQQEIREIPVRNLNLFMTVNPTVDKKMKERFGDADGDKLISSVIAALARDDVPIEDSFFARWSDIIDLSQFPMEAKVPSLVDGIRSAAQQEYSANPRLVLATPEILNKVVEQFSDANAREFLGTAIHGILNIPSDVPEAPLYLVYPKLTENEVLSWENFSTGSTQVGERSGFDSRKINEFIRKNTVVQAVRPDDIKSQMELMDFMLQGFRLHLYGALAQSSQRDEMLAGDFDKRTSWLTPYLLAILTNTKSNDHLPIHEIRLRLGDFGDLTNSQEDEIEEYILTSEKEFGEYFPFDISGRRESSLSLSGFLGEDHDEMRSRNRLEVMIDTTERIRREMDRVFLEYFRMKGEGELIEDPSEWIESLNEKDPTEVFEAFGSIMAREFVSFSGKLYGNEIDEVKNSGEFEQMTGYDEARLFLMCVDKAMTQLNWVSATKLIMDVMEYVSHDSSLGQSMPFQQFMFKSAMSPLSTITSAYLHQSVGSSRSIKAISDEKVERFQRRFESNCPSYLRIKGEGQ